MPIAENKPAERWSRTDASRIRMVRTTTYDKNREIASLVEIAEMVGTEVELPAGIKEVQREMARIRLEMHQEVAGAANGVHILTDWRNIVREHPWASVATAAVVGYLMARRLVRGNPARPAERPGGRSWHPGRELASFTWRVITPIAERVAQAFLVQEAESWLAQRSFQRASGEQGPYPDERRDRTAPAAGAWGDGRESREAGSVGGGVAGPGG
jgi:ElaB/YqjD/DUF883 family membrane-anchored ribosome-binding protein